MVRKKMLYCWECNKDTPHQYIGKETGCEGTGLFRPLMAIATLGVSESALYTYYQCEQCGHIKKCG